MHNGIPPRLFEISRYQAGVVSRRQAMQAGMPESSIGAKVMSGRWRHIYLGVYATFTGAMPRDAWLWAAVLYAGRGAQLSHQTAAELLRLTDQRSPLIHLTIPAERRVRPVSGVVVHRSSHLEALAVRARHSPAHLD